MMRNAIIMTVWISLIGCSYTASTHRDIDIFEGYCVLGFEVNWFQPCGKKEKLCLSGESEALNLLSKQYEINKMQDYGPVYVRLKGSISKDSTYCVRGFSRQFWVEEILLVRQKRMDDCN